MCSLDTRCNQTPTRRHKKMRVLKINLILKYPYNVSYDVDYLKTYIENIPEVIVSDLASLIPCS
jgi:hypothetical protein